MNERAVQLSIVVVTHNSEPALKPFLHSLVTATKSISCEYIFVDNRSSDRSVMAVRSSFPTAKVIENSHNFGFGAAVNRGAKEATGEWLALLNPDLILEPDSLAKLIDHAGRLEQLGLATGKISSPDGTFQSVCRNIPTLSNLIFSRGFFLSRLIGSSSNYTIGDSRDDTPVPALAGTMMLCRRAVWDELDGFDERFFMFMEDTDLCFRALEAGYKNYYIPSARATHAWGRGSNIGSRLRKQYHHRSMWLYFRKHSNPLLAWSVVPLFLMLNLFASLVFRPENDSRT